MRYGTKDKTHGPKGVEMKQGLNTACPGQDQNTQTVQQDLLQCLVRVEPSLKRGNTRANKALPR